MTLPAASVRTTEVTVQVPTSLPCGTVKVGEPDADVVAAKLLAAPSVVPPEGL